MKSSCGDSSVKTQKSALWQTQHNRDTEQLAIYEDTEKHNEFYVYWLEENRTNCTKK